MISPGSRMSGSRLGWALKDCSGLTYVHLALEGAMAGGASLAKGDAMRGHVVGSWGSTRVLALLLGTMWLSDPLLGLSFFLDK